ncbi:PRY3 [Scenedesmus sp. PABB004]|nr:PRY3 [Scenedesmus sp. PABB004]
MAPGRACFVGGALLGVVALACCCAAASAGSGGGGASRRALARGSAASAGGDGPAIAEPLGAGAFQAYDAAALPAAPPPAGARARGAGAAAPTAPLVWDLAAGAPCSLSPGTDPAPRYCEPGLVRAGPAVGRGGARPPRGHPATAATRGHPAGRRRAQVCYPAFDWAFDPGPRGSYDAAAAASRRGSQPDAAGVCASAPPGVLLPRSYPTPWPTPLAYFPLARGLTSFPDGAWSGALHGAAFARRAADARWGGSLACDGAAAAAAALDAVPYADDGDWAVSIWLRLPPAAAANASGASAGVAGAAWAAAVAGGGGRAGGAGFQYVAIMLPAPGHPRHGVLRAVVRDSDDAAAAGADADAGGPAQDAAARLSAAWLDSDGHVGDDGGWSDAGAGGGDAPGGPASAQSRGDGATNPNLVDFGDGEWHHVVVSTLPLLAPGGARGAWPGARGEGRPGFRLYVDGLLRAELSTSRNRRWRPPRSAAAGAAGGAPGGGWRRGPDRAAVTSGDPARLDGPLTLCGRADRDPASYFSGQLAQLQVFDSGLDERAARRAGQLAGPRRAALHAVTGPVTACAPPRRRLAGGLARSSVRGARCLLPTSWGGQLSYGCVVLPDDGGGGGGGPGCVTGPRGSWEACSAAASGRYSSGGAAPRCVLDLDADGGATVGGGGPPAPAPPDADAGPRAAEAALLPSVRARLAAAGGASVYSFSPRLPRFTLSGQACADRPFSSRRIGGGAVTPARACATLGGAEVCPVPRPAPGGGVAWDLLQCTPLVAVPANSTYCALAAASSGGSGDGGSDGSSGSDGGSADGSSRDGGSIFSECVVSAGLEFCRIAGRSGPWVACPACEPGARCPCGALPARAPRSPALTRGLRAARSRWARHAGRRRLPAALPLRRHRPHRLHRAAAGGRRHRQRRHQRQRRQQRRQRQRRCHPSADGASSDAGGDPTASALSCPPADSADASGGGAEAVAAQEMAPCDDSSLFTAAAARSPAESAGADGPSDAGWLTEVGLPAPGDQTLAGLVPPAGSGTRRYSLVRAPCAPLPAGNIDGRAAPGPAPAPDATPPAGAAVCVANRELGAFECAVAGGAPAVQPCAPLARATTSGAACALPFTWRGVPRDDCVWQDGLEVCPVAAAALQEGSNGSLAALLAGPGPGGPWRWEQCVRDYSTQWQLPPATVPGRRYSVSGFACSLPFVLGGVSRWDCVSNDTDASGGSDGAASGAGLAAGDASAVVGALGACPLVTGEWAVCAPAAPANASSATLGGGRCALPFASFGTLHHACTSASNGSAGLCKDSSGAWQACLAERTGAVSGRPCLLPARAVAAPTADQGSDADGGGGQSSDSGGGDGGEVWTDCILLLRSTPGLRLAQPAAPASGDGAQREESLVQACWTAPTELEECLPANASAAAPPDSAVVAGTAAAATTSTAAAQAQRERRRRRQEAARQRDGNELAPAPPRGAAVPLAVGVAVGVGGTLLLALAGGLVAAKRGWVYQLRSRRFVREMLDGEPADGAGGAGGGGGAVFSVEQPPPKRARLGPAAAADAAERGAAAAARSAARATGACGVEVARAGSMLARLLSGGGAGGRAALLPGGQPNSAAVCTPAPAGAAAPAAAPAGASEIELRAAGGQGEAAGTPDTLDPGFAARRSFHQAHAVELPDPAPVAVPQGPPQQRGRPLGQLLAGRRAQHVDHPAAEPPGASGGGDLLQFEQPGMGVRGRGRARRLGGLAALACLALLAATARAAGAASPAARTHHKGKANLQQQQQQHHRPQSAVAVRAAAAARAGRAPARRARPGAAQQFAGLPPAPYEVALVSINGLRALHRAPPLAWGASLAAGAAGWAAQCQLASDPDSDAGELLFVSSVVDSVAVPLAAAARSWYGGAARYNYSQPRFSPETGAFTQLVWRASTDLGCAVQRCARGVAGTGFTDASLVVCRFSPAGNMAGGFAANVLPPLQQPQLPPASPAPGSPAPAPAPASPAPVPASPSPAPAGPSPAPEPEPSPAPAGPSPEPSPVPVDATPALALHNAVRAVYGAPPLAWDAGLAAGAARAAAACSFDGASGEGFGTNVFASTSRDGARALAAASAVWAGQAAAYNFSAPGYQAAAAGFTQLVWRGSTSLGCAVQWCAGGVSGLAWPSGSLVVCRYAPPGNPRDAPASEWAANVLPPPRPGGSPAPGGGAAPASPAPAPVPAPDASPLPPGGHDDDYNELPPGPEVPGGGAPARSTLKAGEALASPACLSSSNRLFKLCVHPTGNVVLYQGKDAVWASNTAYKSTKAPFALTLQAHLPVLVGVCLCPRARGRAAAAPGRPPRPAARCAAAHPRAAAAAAAAAAGAATDAEGAVIWKSRRPKGRTGGRTAGHRAVLGNDGSFAILTRDGRAVWRARSGRRASAARPVRDG